MVVARAVAKSGKMNRNILNIRIELTATDKSVTVGDKIKIGKQLIFKES